MDIFSILIANVLPLYGLIALGFLISRASELDIASIATLMLYALVPAVMFGATASMELDSRFIVPPLLVAFVSCTASITAYQVGQRMMKDQSYPALLGMVSVSSNATYFGIPIAIALFGIEWLGPYMIMVLPLFILDATLSYYMGSRGKFDPRESVMRVLKLPIIYAVIAGLAFNMAGFALSPLMETYWERFTGAMIILGMMMIGAALGQVERFRFDWKFFGCMLASRYLLWGVLMVGIIVIDLTIFQFLDPVVHQLLLLIYACPLAANNVAYAAKIGLHPALTASTVLTTTLQALIYIPLIFWLASVVGLI